MATCALAGGVPTITREALSTSPNVLILDVRQQAEWEWSTYQIAGAFRHRAREVGSWAGRYDPSAIIVVYCSCPEQATSVRVAEQLLALGFERVYVLEGGWDSWASADYPLEPIQP